MKNYQIILLLTKTSMAARNVVYLRPSMCRWLHLHTKHPQTNVRRYPKIKREMITHLAFNNGGNGKSSTVQKTLMDFIAWYVQENFTLLKELCSDTTSKYTNPFAHNVRFAFQKRVWWNNIKKKNMNFGAFRVPRFTLQVEPCEGIINKNMVYLNQDPCHNPKSIWIHLSKMSSIVEIKRWLYRFDYQLNEECIPTHKKW